jgi:hypothetical protein
MWRGVAHDCDADVDADAVVCKVCFAEWVTLHLSIRLEEKFQTQRQNLLSSRLHELLLLPVIIRQGFLRQEMDVSHTHTKFDDYGHLLYSTMARKATTWKEQTEFSRSRWRAKVTVRARSTYNFEHTNNLKHFAC